MKRSKRKQLERQLRGAVERTHRKHGDVGTVKVPRSLLAVLNAGEGDLKLSFDKSNEPERERAKNTVEDMLRRGYAIFVQVGEQDGEPVYARAKSFDAERCEYLVVGVPESAVPPSIELREDAAAPYGRKSDGTPRKRPGRSTTVRVAADKTRAVGVARSAGG